jgi:hypothetical protein
LACITAAARASGHGDADNLVRICRAGFNLAGSMRAVQQGSASGTPVSHSVGTRRKGTRVPPRPTTRVTGDFSCRLKQGYHPLRRAGTFIYRQCAPTSACRLFLEKVAIPTCRFLAAAGVPGLLAGLTTGAEAWGSGPATAASEPSCPPPASPNRNYGCCRGRSPSLCLHVFCIRRMDWLAC